ncbi:MAG: 16S rRNA (cytosine(1402)-N(4))-methyltransferase RsmH [Patescibacteria group bacterium]|nr:16S rRNA (cytosine(1402)-N(4))-methyltransferase RsmH [Patescibacteria group bacterium]MDD5121457.1 16S rRNA (cytosine(1402)-N(4))-methyltransferase RsmH [Patescibacteria group bacterium]MDD5222031.1 16S rRNA (cytosine(1402)-N(4))-methyltransferase RsmH [Patescibacteria group bacterium]MDD5396381.1 16S rRNA (cytosine(1402)-N(4))-methyltransferase RsmH [Patescibacteria group bacterium]
MHTPVLLNEVLNGLSPRPNDNFIDCTLGGGGHALEILRQTAPLGKLLGIDFSMEAISEMKVKIDKNLNDRLILVNDNFVNLESIARKNKFLKVRGILFDLGLSTDLIENRGRGISFQKNEILDMRFNPLKQNLTALEILNQWPEQDLAEIFEEFGEERFAHQIARGIVVQRRQKRIKTTVDLAEAIKKILGPKFHIKSLARIFQALRIAVNHELEYLSSALPQAVDLLAPGGRLAVISFHSLEDRIVKNFYKNNLNLNIITKKPITSTQEELRQNKRARSAKLRIAEKN